MCALLSEQGAGVALRIAPCRRSSALTAIGAWEVRIVVLELGVLCMYAISMCPNFGNFEEIRKPNFQEVRHTHAISLCRTLTRCFKSMTPPQHVWRVYPISPAKPAHVLLGARRNLNTGHCGALTSAVSVTLSRDCTAGRVYTLGAATITVLSVL